MLHDGKFRIKLGLPSGNAFPTDPAPTQSDVFYREDEDKVYTYDGASWNELGAAGGAGLYSDYIHIRDQKAAGTAGGGFTQGAWRTRDLTIELDDTGNDAALAANQITLEAGTYRALISCPAYRVNWHKARLRNITDGATELVGTSEFCGAAIVVSNRSFIVGRFTLAAQKVLEVQHYCQATFGGDGFGRGLNFGEVEVFTEVELWKEA